MTGKDKLEIGLKDNAPILEDNGRARFLALNYPWLLAVRLRSRLLVSAEPKRPTEPKLAPHRKKAHRVVPVRSSPAK